jgi:glycine/D-amino acid oxidase-like deaminating enzyme
MLTLISGVIGLTTAIQLLEKGEKVTIVTKNLSYSCSQVAG